MSEDAGLDYLLSLRRNYGDNRVLREAVEAVLAKRLCGVRNPDYPELVCELPFEHSVPTYAPTEDGNDVEHCDHAAPSKGAYWSERAYVKPPLGVLPRSIWLERRLENVSDAIARREEVGLEPLAEWLIERRDLLVELSGVSNEQARERFIVLNLKDGEAEYLAYDDEELSEFATDVAHALTFNFVDGTGVEQVEVTLKWKGTY